MQNYEVSVQEDSELWIRENSGAIFAPSEVIPSFEEFKNGLTATSLEDYDYEDLLFLPLIGHYLSKIPEFRGPKLVLLSNELRRRAAEVTRQLDETGTTLNPAASSHRVGVELEGDSVRSTDQLLSIARERASRVAYILKSDLSTPEITAAVGNTLSDQEAVDIYIYSLIAHEDYAQIPISSWPLQQAEKALDYQKKSRAGEPLTYGLVIDGIAEFIYNPSFNGSTDDYPLFLLTDKNTGKPTELCCDNGIHIYMRMGQWAAMPNLEYFESHFDFRAVKNNPVIRYELISKWDRMERDELDLDYFLEPVPEEKNSPPRTWQDPLTQEQIEQFYSNWAEKMPEVLNWTEDEIKMGLATGM